MRLEGDPRLLANSKHSLTFILLLSFLQAKLRMLREQQEQRVLQQNMVEQERYAVAVAEMRGCVAESG